MKRFTRRLIALGEIAQGLIPFLFAGDAIQLFGVFRHFDDGVPLAYRILQFGFYIAVCALTLVSGVLLWGSRPLGLRLSALAQAAQIPVVTSTAFSYAVKLGFGVWLFYHFDTTVAGFTAALLDDTELALVFSGEPVAPAIQVNVLAVCILVCLLRAMRGERSDYVAPPRTPLFRRTRRIAAKSLLVLLAIVFVPLLALWIYNRFDEKPTRSAEHWFAPMPQTAADRENAWLYMLGLGAAENDDPIAFGRRRLAAYEARIAQRVLAPPSAEERALEADPLPFQPNDRSGNKVEFCDTDERDCLPWAKTAAAQLAELESANAVLLQRFATLLGMTRFEELATPSADDPIPNIGKVLALHRALLLRDLTNPATRGPALQRMALAVAFWQRAEDPAASEFMKAFAEHERERYMRVLDALIDQSGGKDLDSLRDTIDAVLREPTDGQREWEPALHREALHFATVMDKTVIAGPIDAIRYCKSDCLKNWLIAQFYLPQATRNLYARLWDAVLDAHNSDPRAMSEAQARVSQVFESSMPLTDSSSETLRRISYNGSGKVLALISLPAYADFIYRQHDTEALRRMLLVKITALRQNVPARNMPDLLARQPPSLRNPYTGEPLGWDEAKGQIVFAPKSKKWKTPLFSVVCLSAADVNPLASTGKHLPQPAKR